jgi:hypothetical protein
MRGNFLGRRSLAEDLRSVALHEAAHAVYAERLGGRVLRVWLERKRLVTRGWCEMLWPKRKGHTDAFARALELLAGHEAEHRVYGRPINQLPSLDWRDLKLLGLSYKSACLAGWLTRKILPEYLSAIRRVQRALITKGELSGREVRRILRSAK